MSFPSLVARSRRAIGTSIALIITWTAHAETFEVRRGDTFSQIAARVTGNPSTWQTLYDAAHSGLPDPNLVFPGDRFELVRREGSSYLKLVDAGAARGRVATLKPAPAPAAEVKVAIPATLTVGVLPNIGASALLAQYEHMKRFLERAAGKPVAIATSANFRTFFASTMQGEYDVAITASHFARVAQVDRGLVPIAIYQPPIRALLVTSAEKPIGSLRELKDGAIAFANPQSLVAMYGFKWLAAQGLAAERDYQLKTTRTDMGIGPLVLAGEARAAILSNGEFRQIPEDHRRRLKVVNEFAEIPNFVVLAHPRLGARLIAELRAHLKAFNADETDGAAFRKASGVAAIVEPGDAQMRELDAYVGETRRLMSATQ